VEEINGYSGEFSGLAKLIRRFPSIVLKRVEKETKIVPKNHYRNVWMLLGMSAFGMPIGVSFGILMGNLALLGLGLPIGMAVGLAVGSGLDKKACKEDKQLDFQLEV
jgi:hypothetical protein